VFLALAGIGLVLLLASRQLPETVPPARRSPPRFATMLADSATLLRDRQFAGNALAVALSMAALLSYISSAPFIIEDGYRQSPQRFSLIFAINALGIMTMGQLSARLVRRRAPGALLLAALAAQAAGGAALMAAALSGHPPLLVLLLPLFVVVAAFGMVRPNGTALALAGHASIAGTASAYLGALPFLSGAVLAPLAGAGGRGAAVPAAILIGILCLAALGLNLLLARGRRPPEPSPEPGGGEQAAPGQPTSAW
jgi:DHA1 family bicyclomycin/chloramphenicol resistance-like MFS transporter